MNLSGNCSETMTAIRNDRSEGDILLETAANALSTHNTMVRGGKPQGPYLVIERLPSREEWPNVSAAALIEHINRIVGDINRARLPQGTTGE